ncbi:MAG: tetratricopeptide repeat protein [Cytophagales bacterium]|nr:tetratricopeptide repeat protein [Cytophagales bacterium]
MSSNENDTETNYKLELEADEWAGYILGYLDASEFEAIHMLDLITSDSASLTHPAKEKRKIKILSGWNRGRSNKANTRVNKKYLIHQNRSKQYYDSFDFPNAKLELDTAIKYNPFNDELYASRASCFSNMNYFSNALSDANRSLEINTNNVEALRIRAWINLTGANLIQAKLDVEKLMKIDSSKFAFFLHGLLLYRQRDYEGALRNYNQVVQIDSSYYVVYQFRGHLFDFLDRNNEAEKDYNKLIQLFPFSQSYLLKADLNFKIHNLDTAFKYYDLAVAADTNNFKALYKRGSAHLQIALVTNPINWDYLYKAKIDFAKVLQQNPNDLNTLSSLSKALLPSKPDSAILILNKLIKLNPNPLNYYARGSAYIVNEEYIKAIQDFNQIIVNHPRDFLAIHERGVAKMYNNNYEDAISDFSLVLSINPHHYISKFGLALSNYKLEKYDTAIELTLELIDISELLTINRVLFAKFRHYNNLKAFLHYLISEIYDLKGDSVKHLEFLNKTIELEESYADAYFKRGEHYYFIDQDRKAEDDFYKSILYYNKLLESNSDSYCHQQIAEALCYVENYDEALISINKAIDLSPTNNYLFVVRAEIFFERKEYNKAILDLNKIIGDNMSYHYYLRARCNYYLDNWDATIQDINAAFKIENEENGGYYYYRGLANRELENTQAACLDFAKAKELDYFTMELDSFIKEYCNN